ncbi:hypothetical protein BJF77_15835 [Kocuria sp. CNJ-770]|nr:hypothetical protein BJF77_15835 [Kocuria sp. CNJ-770]
MQSELINPHTGTPAPAGDVVAHLLAHLHPVLTEHAEHETVEPVLTSILQEGTGAHRQRQACRTENNLSTILHAALPATP